MFDTGVAVTQQLLVALAVGMALLGVASMMAYPAGAIPSMQSPNSTLPITDEEASWIGSLLPLAALLGTFSVGTLLSFLGRKKFFLFVFAPTLALGWLLCATAVNIYMMYVGRILGGICFGYGFVAAPMYVAETADVKRRGTLTVIPMLCGSVGIFISYVTAAFMDWSMMAWTGLLLVIPAALLLFMVQESPYWLVTKGKTDLAYEALKVLRCHGEAAAADLKIITENFNNAQSVGIVETLSQKPILKAFGVAVVAASSQMWSGFPIVLFYTVDIFQETGADIDSHIATIIVGVVTVIGTTLAMFLVDRLGRKLLLASSSALSGIANAALGVFFFLQSQGKADGLGWLPLASMMLFVIGFQIGLGPLPFLVATEVLPSNSRVILSPIAIAANCISSFAMAKSFIYLKMYIDSYGAFWLYAVFCALMVVFTIVCIPETKGKTEDEIKRSFEDRQ